VKKGKLLGKARKALRAEYGRGFPEVRATRGHPLTEEDKELNRFLAKVRAPIEHPFATIKRVFRCEKGARDNSRKGEGQAHFRLHVLQPLPSAWIGLGESAVGREEMRRDRDEGPTS
jgi:transposase, IS5 family